MGIVADLKYVRHCLASRFLHDLEDLRGSVEPLLHSGFYTEPFGLVNHVETSKTMAGLLFTLPAYSQDGNGN